MYLISFRKQLLNRQLVLTMKLTILFLIVAILQASASGYSQTVTFSGKEVSLKKVFKVIKSQTGAVFFYDAALMLEAKPITVDLKDAPLVAALNEIFKDQPLTWIMENMTITIIKKPVSYVELNLADTSKFNLQLLTVTGRVVNENDEPAAGITVNVKGTKNATATNDNGEFFLIGVDEYATLVFTGVNVETYELKINGRSNFPRIVLKIKVTSQLETVVIGYGTTSKKDLAGSVSTVKVKDIQNIPFLTVDNSLAGKASGVQVTKTDGSPGGAVRIRVRGTTSLLGGNDPLYIIDGIPVQVQSNYIKPGFELSSPVGNDVTGYVGVSAGLSTAFVNGLNSIGGLNINDIESISILKDASASAIYGSKAANGVVIINTKHGIKEMKPEITFSYYGTYSKPILPTVLNAEQYRTLLSEAAKNDYDFLESSGWPILPEVNSIVNTPDIYFGKGKTNWLKEITRNTISHNSEISIRGGGSSTKYYTSISFNRSPGVMKNSNYDRISGKFNIDNEIGKHLRFNTNMNIGYTNQDITDGAYQQALRARPDYSPYDSTGGFTSFFDVGPSYFGYENPVALLTAINNSKTFNMLGSLSGIYEFSQNLHLKTTLSLNMQNYNQRNYIPSYLSIGSSLGNIDNNGGIGSNSNSQMTNWFEETQLSWNKSLNDRHSINLMAGYSYETKKASFFVVTAQGYPNDNVLNNLSSAVTLLSSKGDNPSKPQSYLVSYYLRTNYNFKDKYIFTFTGRADGSSKFGADNKFGYFPSAAIGWRLSQENFLKNIKWIDEIKLRSSLGVTGTQNIGDQMYRTLFTPYYYAGSNAVVPTQLGNPRIKWETTTESDAGIDFSFFSQRFQGTIDYYHKQTEGALLSLPVAPSSSYTSLLGNFAGIRNTGIEVFLQGDIFLSRNFRWNASLNLTWPKSIITKLNTEANLNQLGNLTGLEVGNIGLIQGQPLGLILGRKIVGIINTQKQLDDYKEQLGQWYDYIFSSLSLGDPMFALDTVFDGIGHFPLSNQIIGHAVPKCYGGFTQQFTYKNFDLSFYFTFSRGGQLLWGDHVSSMNFRTTANVNAIAMNRWTPDKPNNNQPRLLLYDQMFFNNTNLSVFSSSYIKLRSVVFNYRLPASRWMNNSGFRNISFFLSATNLFTLTKYPGNDPETSDDPFSVAGGYFDVSNYPMVRTFSLGLKIRF